MIPSSKSTTFILIFALENLLCNANELHRFNQLLVAPVSAAFGAHNAPNHTLHFYKSLFEKGWPLLSCIDSEDDCIYLQVHTKIPHQQFEMLTFLLFQNNAAIAAGSFLAGFAFFLFVFVVTFARRCFMEQNRSSVNSSQINSKLNSVYTIIMLACATVLGCVYAQPSCLFVPMSFFISDC